MNRYKLSTESVFFRQETRTGPVLTQVCVHGTAKKPLSHLTVTIVDNEIREEALTSTLDTEQAIQVLELCSHVLRRKERKQIMSALTSARIHNNQCLALASKSRQKTSQKTNKMSDM